MPLDQETSMYFTKTSDLVFNIKPAICKSSHHLNDIVICLATGSVLKTCFISNLTKALINLVHIYSIPKCNWSGLAITSYVLAIHLRSSSKEFLVNVWFTLLNHVSLNTSEQHQFQLLVIVYHSDAVFNQLTATRRINRSKNKELQWTGPFNVLVVRDFQSWLYYTRAWAFD